MQRGGRPGKNEVIVTSLDDIRDRKLYSISLIFKDGQAAEEAGRAAAERFL